MEALDDRQAPTVSQLIGHARELLAAGVPRDEAAAKLAELASSRAALEGARDEWLRAMHRLPSTDFAATHVLRAVEAALGLMPRTGAERQDQVRARRRHRLGRQ